MILSQQFPGENGHEGLCGGGTFRQSSGSAYTAPNDNIFDCNKGLND
jgi:hypothetical protein